MRNSKIDDENNSSMPAPDKELANQTPDLETQLEAIKGILTERDAEIMGLKGRAESQNQTLEAQFELLEQQKRTENNLMAQISALETQLKSKAEPSREPAPEMAEIKENSESIVQTMEAQLREREKELQTRESAVRHLEERLESKNNELVDQLRQKDSLLRERDNGMAGLTEQVTIP